MEDGPFAAILLYHRIGLVPDTVHQLVVSPDDFDDHLRCLASSFEVVALTDFASMIGAGRVAAPTIAITFDDGYRDNLEAGERLSKAGLPATFFVTSEGLEHGQFRRVSPFWWDVLAAVLIHDPPAKPGIVIDIDGEVLQLPTRSTPDRRTAHDRLHAWLLASPSEARQRALETLVAWRERPLPELPGRLDASGLRALAGCPRLEIGAHTHRHVCLAGLAAERCDDEIRASKAAIERVVGRTVSSFAYPYGAHDDPAVAAVGRAGFVCAVTCEPGIVMPLSDPLRLPRIAVRPGDAAQLAAQLAQVGGTMRVGGAL